MSGKQPVAHYIYRVAPPFVNDLELGLARVNRAYYVMTRTEIPKRIGNVWQTNDRRWHHNFRCSVTVTGDGCRGFLNREEAARDLEEQRDERIRTFKATAP